MNVKHSCKHRWPNDRRANERRPAFDENKFLTNCLTVAFDEIFRWRKFPAIQYVIIVVFSDVLWCRHFTSLSDESVMSSLHHCQMSQWCHHYIDRTEEEQLAKNIFWTLFSVLHGSWVLAIIIILIITSVSVISDVIITSVSDISDVIITSLFIVFRCPSDGGCDSNHFTPTAEAGEWLPWLSPCSHPVTYPLSFMIRCSSTVHPWLPGNQDSGASAEVGGWNHILIWKKTYHDRPVSSKMFPLISLSLYYLAILAFHIKRY